jgi:katanin p80 WD40 repeat-containing subunit B1
MLGFEFARDLVAWQIFSWEPLRCHDVVEVGWHKLADLCIHEGKLLGCSYNQSCVGVWVVDLLVCHH